MRHAYPGSPGNYGYGPYNPPSHGYGLDAEGDRLSQIKRAIDSIEQRLGSSSAARPMAPYANYGTNLTGGHNGWDRMEMPAPSGSQLGMLQAQLSQLASQIGMPSGARLNGYDNRTRNSNFNNPASEIARRQQALNSGGGVQSGHLSERSWPNQPTQNRNTQPEPLQKATENDPGSTINAQLRELKNELLSIRKQVEKPVTVQKTVDQSEIDRIASAIAQLQSRAEPRDSDFDKLAAELEHLRQSMKADAKSMKSDLRNTVRMEVAADRTEMVDGLKDRLDALGSDIRQQLKSQQDGKGNDISSKLDALSRSLEDYAAQSANSVSPKVESLAGQLDYLRMSVDDLPQTLAISRLEDRLGELTEKLEGLTQQSAKAVQAAQASQAAFESSPNGSAGISARDLESVESRLDEISRALVAVSNMGGKTPVVDLSAVDRVEARMAELARTIDSIAERDNFSEFNDLATRIDGLTERLGSFEKYAESGDLGAASAMFAAPDIGVIEEQLRLLNERVEMAAAGPQTAVLEDKIARLMEHFEEVNTGAQTRALENQIALLSQQIEDSSHSHSTAAQMSNLEAQIGQIIRHMNKQSGAATVDFAPVESRLGQIEQHLVNSQGFSFEAAQQAAQQAVQMMGPQSESGQFIEALSQDLRALQEAAEGGNAQNAHTINQLQDMLGQVVERLGSIEGAIEQAATKQASMISAATRGMPKTAEFAGHSFDRNQHESGMERHANETVFAADGLADAAMAEGDLGVMHKAALEAGYVEQPDRSDARLGHIDSPSMDPGADIDRSIGALPEDNSPLEPGTVGSDLEKLVQQASAKLSKTRSEHDAPRVAPHDHPMPPKGQDDVRPDAVAAARRALQATTAEMNAVRSEAGKEGKASATGGLQAKLAQLLPSFDMSRLRKPLVLGAAALLLAVIAFKGIGIFTGGGEKTVAAIDVPAIESTISNKAQSEESTETKNEEIAVSNENAAPVRAVDEDQTSRDMAANSPANDQLASSEPMNETAISQDAATDQTEPEAMPEENAGTQNAPEVAAAEPTSQDPIEAEPEPVSVDVTSTPPAGSASTFEVPSSVGSAALVAAASTGDPKALFQIGMRYSEGEDVKRNMTESAKWFERAAQAGFAPAQYSIGSLYEKGIGVERNIQKAAEWYDKAAVQGNARAMHNLAVIHAMGNPPEIQPDMDKAVGWFQQAADLGIKDSQFNLGILYGQGMGVPQNLVESYKWFALAAKTGDSDANKKRDEVANAMDPDDLDDARRAVNNWAPSNLKEAVNRVEVPDEWKGKGTATNNSAAASGEDAIKQAQLLLNQRGFSVGTPDGKIGPKTKRAIMEFQRSAGIPITGQVDAKLLQALDMQT